MRKLILLALLFVTISSGAQITDSTGYCKAYFIYSFNTIDEAFAPTPGTAVNFYDQSDGEVVAWNWDFGDGSTSTEQNPIHIFNHPVYPDGYRIMINPFRTVTLTTTTSDSCSATYSETINIYDVPGTGGKTCKSDFYFFQTGYDSLAQTATFKFMNMSGAESARYFWDFSDGIISYEAEPEMTFDFSRTERKVCLTVSGSDSCFDELCQTVFIDPKGWGTDPADSSYSGCFTAFGYYVNTDIKPLAPALVLDFYTKSDQPVAKCLWDFGDGITSDELNPTHIFNFPVISDSALVDPNPFRYVCLTVTTESGCESTWCETINIYMNTNPVEECFAWFSYYVPGDVMTIPEVVPYQFIPVTENVVSWEWSFEDGTVSYDPEPMMTFDIFKPTQKVCLTILTADSCESSWCETIFVSTVPVDTVYPEPSCGYRFKYISSYPEYASSCIGTVTAQVVFGDSLVPVDFYYWSTPDGQIIDGPVLNNACPTQTYSVTARTMDGCKFSRSIIFNSDGTVTEAPISWWISGWGDDYWVEYVLPDSSYSVEWIGCDGSVYKDVNILLNELDCDTKQPNMILKDSKGNIVYSETVDFRTEIPVLPNQMKLMIYPNPVRNTLNLRFSSINDTNAKFVITDVTGKILQMTNLTSLKTGLQVGIDVSALEHGIYFGRIVSGNHVIATEKFIK